MTRIVSLVAALLFVASLSCSKSPDSATEPTAGSATTVATKPIATGEKPMSTDFERALEGFRKYAAETLETSEIEVLPDDADGVMPGPRGRVGALIRFQGRPAGSGGVWLNALADPSNVVTPEQHLGRLFEEAGVFGGSPTLDAKQLAEQIVWIMGPTARLSLAPSPTLAFDGTTGTLTFTVVTQEVGPGGAGGGPERTGNATVTLAGGHEATLAVSF